MNMVTVADVFLHFVNKDNQRIFCKYWEPNGDIRALAFILHGLAEHVQKYDKVATFLTDLGFKVCGHDHIGHGKSDGTRIDVEKYEYYARDALQHVDLMKEKYPNLPVFLVSHSTGSLVAIAMSNERPTEFHNVMIAPTLMFNTNDASRTQMRIIKLMSPLISSRKEDPIDCNKISRNAAVNTAYDSDQLTYRGPLRDGYLIKVYNTMTKLEQSYSSITWPFILLYGTEDSLAEVSYCEKLYTQAASEDKTINRYEGYHHQLHNEPEEYSAKVFADIKLWLSKRLKEKN